MPDHALLLTVQYDGTDFAGWQLQPGQRTVQGVVEQAIAAIDGAALPCRGASRTDAGVHALGQRVAFDPRLRIPPSGWLEGLNGKLPNDVVVSAAQLRPRGYDPRFDAVGKHYRYLVHHAPLRDPMLRRTAWHVRANLDLPAMREAAALLVGQHDFRAFQAANDYRDNTIRRIFQIDLADHTEGNTSRLTLDVRGNAFLKNMVRIIAGTLIEVGRGRRTVAQVASLLLPTAQRRDAGMTAPAHGLSLVSIELGRAEQQNPTSSTRSTSPP